jgi:hypothetical protein
MNWAIFFSILSLIESSGRMDAVGDKATGSPAYGLYQIRQAYLTDANRIAGTSYSLKEVAASKKLSQWCVQTYIGHYGKQYTAKTGKPVTMEVAARIHNGGPMGWKKPKSTEPYWSKWRKEMIRRHGK